MGIHQRCRGGPPLAKLEKDKFDQMWDELMRTTTAFDVTQVSFIGCDDVCLMKCLDLYYAAATTSGPMVIKFSLEFGVKGHARLFGIKTYTGWDEIKQVVRGIQHVPKLDSRSDDHLHRAESED